MRKVSGFRCYICGKKRSVGRQVSHSGVRTPRVFSPNLQFRHIMLGGQRVRIRICTKCLKRMKKDAKVVQVEKIEAAPQVSS